MGIKFLNLQSIPWLLQAMGNHVSCVQLRQDSQSRTVKLIKSDGVNIYHRPIIAGELMNQFPKHLICHSDSFYIGRKVRPLSETEELQLGHKYFLLPKHFFQSALSFVTIASFTCSPPSSSKEEAIRNDFIKRVAMTCRPFDIHKTANGTLQIRVSDEFISKLMEKGTIKDEEENSNEIKRNKICNTPELLKDYTQLVGSLKSRQWKPKLETIREKERRKISSFGIKRRRKTLSKSIPKTNRSEPKSRPRPPLPPPPPPPPPSRSSLSKGKWKKKIVKI